MPDASWWDGAAEEQRPRTVAELEAEVRRLRSALLRISDELSQAQTWEALRAAALRAQAEAAKALGRRR